MKSRLLAFALAPWLVVSAVDGASAYDDRASNRWVPVTDAYWDHQDWDRPAEHWRRTYDGHVLDEVDQTAFLGRDRFVHDAYRDRSRLAREIRILDREYAGLEEALRVAVARLPYEERRRISRHPDVATSSEEYWKWRERREQAASAVNIADTERELRNARIDLMRVALWVIGPQHVEVREIVTEILRNQRQIARIERQFTALPQVGWMGARFR